MSTKADMAKNIEMTTIAISAQNKNLLQKLKRGYDTFDDVISRMVNDQADIYLEFVLIDNELPHRHSAVFQLGEDKNSLYYFNGEEIHTFTVEEANKIIKEKHIPKTRKVTEPIE
jgi:hypothetical protein